MSSFDAYDLAKDIIDRAISAMPMAMEKNIIQMLSTSPYLILGRKTLRKQNFVRKVLLYMLKECNIYPE